MSLADRLGGPSAAGGRREPPKNADAAPAAAPPARDGSSMIHSVKRSVHRALVVSLGPRLYDPHMVQSELEGLVRRTLQSVIEREETPLSGPDRTRVAQEVSDEILGLGPIEPLLANPDVSEVMVNGPDDVFVEIRGKLHRTDVAFYDEAHLRRVIDKIVSAVGRRVDESSPLCDARLQNGSRVNVVVPPIAVDGSLLTIRKFSTVPLSVRDLIASGTLTPALWSFVEACVRGRLNVLISGGTGSGKTTTLNVLSSAIPSDERIVTIEDAAELSLHQEHVLRLEARPPNIEGRGTVSIRELVRNALRMRPERIVVGEVRDGAALDMLQAMNTGHDGSLATAHSNGPRDSLSRLETMVLMAGVDLPVRAIREQVASAVDLVVHQSRLKDGSRRITHVTEVLGMEGDTITLQDIFLMDYSAGFDAEGRFRGGIRPTGLRPAVLDVLADRGVSVDPRVFSGEPR